MRVRQQHCIYFAQPVLGKPFDSSSLKVLSDIDDDSAVMCQSVVVQTAQEPHPTHTFFPSLPSIRTTALVFRLILRLPSGFKVERQVRHGGISGGAVKHSTWGTEEEVPVPRKINSRGSTEDDMGNR